jgi:hypothetical protein
MSWLGDWQSFVVALLCLILLALWRISEDVRRIRKLKDDERQRELDEWVRQRGQKPWPRDVNGNPLPEKRVR